MTGTYSKNLPRLYHAAQERASYAKKVNEKLRREIALLRKTVDEQRQLLRAMEEGYSMRRTA